MKQSLLKKFKLIVQLCATFSDDTKEKVGSILLRDERIIATGYNGQIPKQPHVQIIKFGHDISTVHAEMNCLMFCAKQGISTNNTILFSTHSPCQICTKLLIQAGIKHVYYIKPYDVQKNPFFSLLTMEQI